MTESDRTPGTLTLIGSGELAPSMSKVHRAMGTRIAGALRPAVVDTPAGFEPNCGDISAKAVAYLERHLGCKCEVASYRAPGGGGAAEVRRALATLQRANYIFAGPGSPTYAVRCWMHSPVLEKIARRLAEGAQLVFASAAAIASGAYALPVYEIFKAGTDLHWVEGTDLLGRYGIRLAIVPHWNNTEGGTYDTGCCFMGRERFERLEALLDPRAVVLGIDEHTACTIDLAARQCDVTGIGHVTIRRGAQESAHATGTSFPLAMLGSVASADAVRPGGPAATSMTDDRRAHLVREIAAASGLVDSGREGMAGAASAAFALACPIADAVDAGVDRDTAEAARSALAALVAAWSKELTRPSGAAAAADSRPLLDLLILVRRTLRAQGDWPLADSIRDRLAELGIALEDTPRETVWRPS
ncbi:MAG: hypothetical protein ACYDEB_02165 [Dehalococcoidia bacterium]